MIVNITEADKILKDHRAAEAKKDKPDHWSHQNPQKGDFDGVSDDAVKMAYNTYKASAKFEKNNLLGKKEEHPYGRDIAGNIGKELKRRGIDPKDLKEACEMILDALEENTLLEKTNLLNDTGVTGYPKTDKNIEGVAVSLSVYNKNDNQKIDELLANLDKDYQIIKNGYKKFINTDFKEWLKVSDEEFKTLELYDVVYNRHYYDAKYSPTKENGDFSSCEFCYTYKDSEGYKNPVAINFIIVNKKLKKESCYDI